VDLLQIYKSIGEVQMTKSKLHWLYTALGAMAVLVAALQVVVLDVPRYFLGGVRRG